MLQKEHSAGLTDSQIQKILAESLGHHMQAFRCSRAAEGLARPEAFETILYSLDKQDLILVLKIVEILSTTQSPRLALHTLVKRVTEILGVARSSLIFLNQARGVGTVVISHEDPDFKGVAISLDSYPEILQSTQTGTITIVKNPAKDPLMHSLREDQLSRIQDVSIMALPLVFQKKAFGILLVQKQRSEEGFSIREVRICQLALGMALRTLQRMCEAMPRRTAKRGRMAVTSDSQEPDERERTWGDSILFSGTPIGILMLDGQERVVRANPSACEITGIPRDGLLGTLFEEIVPKERIEEIRRLRRTSGDGDSEPMRYHLSYGCPTGVSKTLSFAKHSITERPDYAWVFIRDVTKEKHLEEHLQGKTEQLTKANRSLKEARASLLQRNEDLQKTNERLEELHKMKTGFLAVATHEIRTPLSIILGYDRLLLKEKFGSLTPQQKRILEESVQSCERLLNIVNEMLDLTKLESGKLKLCRRQEDILPLLKRVYRQMKMISDRAGVQLLLDLPAGSIRLPFDPDRIEQVLVNLISNSIKFTPRKGIITLAARKCEKEGSEEDWLEITVSDTGKGLPSSMLEKIFEGFGPFPVEAKEPGQSNGIGMGLGLGICKQIVEAHGGRIDARSREGQGSTFVFSLPASVGKSEEKSSSLTEDPIA